jgi:hypothetical protein
MSFETNNSDESRILNETYEFYTHKFMNLPVDDYSLVHSELIKARSAIRRSDVKTAVRLLTTVFEVASQHDWFEEDVIYPGPGSFDQLTHYLD